MKVLIADDDPFVRGLIGAFLASKGHELQIAEDGEQAVALGTSERFDLVLMDGFMPKMSGSEAIRRLKQFDRDAGRFTPILLVSGIEDPVELAQVLSCGADDSLSKPISFPGLEAKLRIFERIAIQQRALDQYRLASETDALYGRTVMEDLHRLNAGQDPSVRHCASNGEHPSGDLFAAARGPDNALYGLLADATGTGLGASLANVALAQLFYSMVESGSPLERIVADANAKLKALLPTGFFTAAAFVRVEPETRRVQIWNGGIPLVRLRTSDGDSRSFGSHHLPLGVLHETEFDAAPTEICCAANGEILLATNRRGETVDELALDDTSFEELSRHIESGATEQSGTVAVLEMH